MRARTALVANVLPALTPMLKGFVSAVRTLSVLPIPGKDAEEMTASLPWFPVVGALLGAILFGLWRLLAIIGLDTWSLSRNGQTDNSIIPAQDAVEAVNKALELITD